MKSLSNTLAYRLTCIPTDTTTQEWTQLPDMKEKRCYFAATALGNRIYIVGGYDDLQYLSSCEVFDTSTNTWSSSALPEMNEKRNGCQAVTIGSSIYVMGGWNGSTDTSSVDVMEMSLSSLYPIDDNFVTVEDGFCTPKSLENLCIDQVCRSLPDLDGELPPDLPQYIVYDIQKSLISHGALNALKLKALRHYELGHLPLPECNEWIPPLCGTVHKSKFRRLKFSLKSVLLKY